MLPWKLYFQLPGSKRLQTLATVDRQLRFPCAFHSGLGFRSSYSSHGVHLLVAKQSSSSPASMKDAMIQLYLDNSAAAATAAREVCLLGALRCRDISRDGVGCTCASLRSKFLMLSWKVHMRPCNFVMQVHMRPCDFVMQVHMRPRGPSA